MNKEESDILHKVVNDPVLSKLRGHQWIAIVNLVASEVHNHHVDWCTHVYCDGKEPKYSPPTKLF